MDQWRQGLYTQLNGSLFAFLRLARAADFQTNSQIAVFCPYRSFEFGVITIDSFVRIAEKNNCTRTATATLAPIVSHVSH